MTAPGDYLLIDAGNSRVKYGCHGGGRWLLRDILVLAEHPRFALPTGFEPERIVIANVAGPAVAAALTERLAGLAEHIEWLRGSAERCGLRCDYEDPARLGADRWAAAVGAWTLYAADCLVVCAGTATTIDVVCGTGHFAGGCILPGLELMLESLARGTAGLPLAQGRFSLPPRNTHDAILTGCLQAQAGAIDRMRNQLSTGATVVLAGGNATSLAPLLEGRVEVRPWLVLDGLLAIARQPITT